MSGAEVGSLEPRRTTVPHLAPTVESACRPPAGQLAVSEGGRCSSPHREPVGGGATTSSFRPVRSQRSERTPRPGAARRDGHAGSGGSRTADCVTRQQPDSALPTGRGRAEQVMGQVTSPAAPRPARSPDQARASRRGERSCWPGRGPAFAVGGATWPKNVAMVVSQHSVDRTYLR